MWGDKHQFMECFKYGTTCSLSAADDLQKASVNHNFKCTGSDTAGHLLWTLQSIHVYLLFSIIHILNLHFAETYVQTQYL